MKTNNETMRQALRLVQAGRLHAATRTIQHALTGGAAAKQWRPSAAARTQAETQEACIDVEFRVLDDLDALANDTAADSGAARRRPAPWSCVRSGAAAKKTAADADSASFASPNDRAESVDGGFGSHRFTCAAGDLNYKLFIPAGLEPAGAPLLLMLHGCTQTPDDFARGTRMNRLAIEHGYVVAWPEQSAQRNQNRCWNWFRSNDQKRGQGEPEILAELTRHLVRSYRLDTTRVYVAGLSAGGAMAAVLASTHPDVFAAIGVHSGLPIGMASNVPTAFAAMRKGGRRRRSASATTANPVPAIVFHGDRDTTVHPCNGDGVIEQSLGDGERAEDAGSNRTVERDPATGGRGYTRTVHRTVDGRIAAEHWVIHGSAHAWSGGDSAGSYTDPSGPDASAQMLRFFGTCRRSGD